MDIVRFTLVYSTAMILLNRDQEGLKSMASHQCLNCSEPFGTSEFMDYMLRLNSRTIDCYKCPAENYLVPKKSGLYLLLRLIFMTLIFSLIALSVYFVRYHFQTDGIPTATPQNARMSVIFAGVMIGAAIGTGVVIYLIAMKTFIWQTGALSLDRKHKSAADYD